MGICGQDPAFFSYPWPSASPAGTAAPDLTSALTHYLAARLQCASAAVIAPDLKARLTAAGVPEALAARAAALLEELVAARYGGIAPDHRTEANARALVEELDAAFDRVA